jgi:hypothetical protein
MKKAVKVFCVVTALLFILQYAAFHASAEGYIVSENESTTAAPSESADESTPEVLGEDDSASVIDEPSTVEDDSESAEPDADTSDGESAEPDADGESGESAEPDADTSDSESAEPEASEESGESAEPDAEEDSAEDILDIIVPTTDVLNIVVPAEIIIVLDPLELAGRGQIYSDTYVIENHGETDVLLTISDIALIFPNDTDFEALPLPYDQKSESSLKAIFLLMDFGRADISPVVTTDASLETPISILLNAAQADKEGASYAALSFMGNLNENPEVPWNDGDVKITITYTAQTVSIPDEDSEESASKDEEADGEDESEEENSDNADSDDSQEDAGGGETQQDTQTASAEPDPTAVPSDGAAEDTNVTEPSNESTEPAAEPPETGSEAGSSDKPPGDGVISEPAEGDATPDPSENDENLQPPSPT